jgi:hypothetical protein
MPVLPLGAAVEIDAKDRVFRRDFFASDKADHAAILEYASGKWWSRR